MKFLTTIIGILPVLCVVAPASAALNTIDRSTSSSGRISTISIPGAVNLAAARRLPTLKVPSTATTTATTTTATTTTAVLMDDIECVERYTECIKASDVCDFNFEECTTPELFYAKKPQCNSVLLQCSPSGINTLFGTSDLTQLSVTNADLYPSAGSIVGQFIDAGAISNRLDTSSCVKRYTSCLKKDNVCGEDFELCTTNSEFKKQKIYCESTLARCQEDGIKELFGLTDTSRDPTSQSRLGVMITEGQQLAALNSVSTCYKVADQCVLNACGANPYKCIANSDTLLADVVDAIKEGRQLTEEQMKAVANARTKADVSKYIKGLCYETIAGNRYCYATVLKSMPTNKQLLDEENRDEIYADIISSTMTRVDNQLQSTLDKFDKQAKDTCSDVITSCAMRSCGGGLGSACYSKVFGSTNICFTSSGGLATSSGQTTCSINASKTYNEIRLGCEAIVNTDANCQYAAASASQSGYNYSYADIDTFGIVFPEKSKGKDPIGVVARLNKSLRENYSPAAIEQMEKQCKNTVISCVRSLCGADYTGCYRNRTDVMTDTYDTAGLGTGSASGSMSGRVSTGTTTGSSDFDNSMNKVGGVLDFTIIRGLCINTVTQSPVCEEHLKIQMVKNENTEQTGSSWGGATSVRDAWVGAVSGGYTADEVSTRVKTGCTVEESTDKCDDTVVMECDTVDENGCLYTKPYYVSRTDYQMNMAATSLIREVLGNLELEAQAQYNQKLTREHNMCRAANSGGIMGRNDMASTYLWVKLRSKRVPKNYSVNGLKQGEFAETNDLYGAFCRARVTIQSDDQDLQRYIQDRKNSKDWTTAYFAVGDVFTCGSWIPQKDLEAIATYVACKKAIAEGKLDRNENCNSEKVVDKLKLTTGQNWGVFAATIGSGALGATAMDLLQGRTGFGGLLNTSPSKVDECTARVNNELNYWNSYTYNEWCRTDGSYHNSGKDNCEKEGGADKVGDCEPCNTGVAPHASADSIIRKAASSSRTVTTYTAKRTGNDNNFIRQSWVKGHLDELNANDVCGNSSGGAMWGRVGMDALGAAALGTTGYLATKNNIKAANLRQFTEDEQEFMRNVGDHIYCFIGADEAGTYGDLIEISVE